MTWHAVDNLFWVGTTITVTLVWGGMFVSGLRQRSVITMSNLRAERDHSPLLYWSIQAYYALVAVLFACASIMLLANHRFVGATDRWLLALFGSVFLFCAILCVVCFRIGLRTGVAIRRMGPYEPLPPSRKDHPIRYWGVQLTYLFAAALFASLSLVTTMMAFLK